MAILLTWELRTNSNKQFFTVFIILVECDTFQHSVISVQYQSKFVITIISWILMLIKIKCFSFPWSSVGLVAAHFLRDPLK